MCGMRHPYTPPAKCIVVDCPWKFGDTLPGPKRGASKHYDVMTVEELCAFKLPPIDQRAIMFFWRVASMQDEALRVINAWGFQVKSELVWNKTTKHGKRQFGMGRYVRMEHEVCLIAVNDGTYPVNDKAIRSTFAAPVGRHSVKPDEFFEIVERLVGDVPRVELFARKRRPGWTCYGNELTGETNV